MPKPNAIALAADAVQFPAAVFLACRLAAMKPRDDTEIVLFSNSFNDLAIAQQWKVPCDLRLTETSIKLPDAGRISGVAFYRFFVPRLTGATGKILYLDADTYIEADTVWRLFDLDLGEHPMAATRDFHMTCVDTPRNRHELEIGGSLQGRKYLNSGVLLIDAGRWAAANLEKRFVAASIRHSLHDQAAINRVLEGDWLELSPAFNMTPLGHLSLVKDFVTPVISHFTGEAKPWSGPAFTLDHPARAEMERFFPSTPWKRFLSRHYDFSKAWAGVTRPRLQLPPGFTDRAADYLRRTRFADVEQGITEVRTSALAPS